MWGSRDSDLTTHVAYHVFLDHVGRIAHAEEEHQLGDGGLAGHVGATDDSGVQQALTGLVEGTVHATAYTLGNVDDDYTALHSFADALDEPGMARGVACTVGLQHDALDVGCVQQVVKRLLGHAWIEFDEHDVGVHVGAHPQRARRHLPQTGLVILDIQSDFGKFRIVEALEGVEVVGAHLGGTVAAPQVVLKQDGDFLDPWTALLVDGGSHLQGGDQVLLAVGAHLADGQL